VETTTGRLSTAARQRLQKDRTRLDQATARLTALSPLNISNVDTLSSSTPQEIW